MFPIEGEIADLHTRARRVLNFGDHPLADFFPKPAAADDNHAGDGACDYQDDKGDADAEKDAAELSHLKTWLIQKPAGDTKSEFRSSAFRAIDQAPAPCADR